jgi:lipopolysaccharide export LptBFGC system permease protein LptF
MIKNIKILLVILSMNFLTSCFVGYSSNTNFTYLNQQKKELYLKNEENERINKIKSPIITIEQTNAVLIFIEGEKLDFEFEKVGFIEIKGAENSFDDDLIFDLKKEAVRRDCDAIINFKKNYVDRESGVLFSNEPLRRYSSKTYVGVAVKIIKK